MKKMTLCIISALLGITGLGLIFAGAWLTFLGGSFYYLVVGIFYFVAAIFLIKKREIGLYLIYAALIYTIIWAIFERGIAFWPLFSRIMVPLGITIVCSFFYPRHNHNAKLASYLFGGGSTVFLVAMLIGSLIPHNVIRENIVKYKYTENNSPENWVAYGKTAEGTRFSRFTQINRSNVKNLKKAWVYQTGDLGPGIDQNTPLQIDNMIYTCSRNNHVAALDVDTGKSLWTFDPKAKSPIWQRCRSVGYYKVSAPDFNSSESCQERIVMTTIDARLIELDSKTGKLCNQFGENGTVHLTNDMGEIKPGFYFQTSSPLIARDLIVVGGWVIDNQEVGEPSGVIRAFNAKTGELEWAWDLGDPSITKYPPEGKSYTRETPNMWTHAAYDDELGLIYLPLGNTTPDYFSGHRPDFSNEYNSSLVALDVNTGREKWKFQTVHHDIWDYDLPSQPALVNVPDENGKIVPAIMQTTKRGQIFLLDRKTGKPITKVEEKSVPNKSNIPGEYVSPTQPYSVGMPTIGAEKLTEKKMWGATMFDQLACRIQFKKMNYQGDFTPIDLKPTIHQPGDLGGMNWGSVSVDPLNNLAFVNDIRIPSVAWLVPKDKLSVAEKKYPNDGTGHGSLSEQKGTPYGLILMMAWLNALDVPCVEPPFGTITAIDLNSKKIVWQVPVGTAKELGPLGIKTHLPMPIGMPTYAGTSVTAGGLVFFAGSQDYYIRAFDVETGKEVWKHSLPIGSSATPMTYISPKTGKQYILISVGGAAHSKDIGDYVIAFSLQD